MDNYLKAIDRTINVYDKLILSNSNIVAVGRGNKIINGHMIKKRPTLTIFVEKKLASSAIEKSRIIPKYIRGIETDVYECGKYINEIKVNPTTDERLISDNKPAYGGGAIIVERGTNKHISTLAYIFTDRGTMKRLYGLSTGHTFIVGKNPVKIGADVYYRRNTDFNNTYEPWIMGKFQQAKLREHREGDIDVALIDGGDNNLEGRKLLSPGLLNGKIITGTKMVTQKDVDDNEVVYKIGAVTGYTEGRILSINTSEMVYEPLLSKKVFYSNQIITDIRVLSGDSGALGVMKKTQQAFGIQNAGNEKRSSFSNIDIILDAFNLELAF